MTTVRALREDGHDVTHLREQRLHTLPDSEILEKSRRESRTILTFDLDFGELLALGGHALPSAIIFRMRDQRPAAVTPALRTVIAECGVILQSGAIVLVEDRQYRVRRLPVV